MSNINVNNIRSVAAGTINATKAKLLYSSPLAKYYNPKWAVSEIKENLSITCSNCGCKFTYDKVDVDDSGKITCPECSAKNTHVTQYEWSLDSDGNKRFYTRTWADRTINSTYSVEDHDFNNTPDAITIHCYVGQATAKDGCDYLAKKYHSSSSNYVVGHDGSIGINVPECYRATTSGGDGTKGSGWGRVNDARAVTIETACNKAANEYSVTDAAMIALVNLVTDICLRRNIPSLIWSDKEATRKKNITNTSKKGVMTVHMDYTNKACPGDHIYDRLGALATEVNSRLTAIRNAGGLAGDYVGENTLPASLQADKSEWRHLSVDKLEELHSINYALDYITPTVQWSPGMDIAAVKAQWNSGTNVEPEPDPEPEPEPDPHTCAPLTLESLEMEAISTNSARLCLKTNQVCEKCLSEYSWKYVLKTATTQKVRDIIVSTNNTLIELADLQPNTQYTFTLTATKGSSSLSLTQIFHTEEIPIDSIQLQALTQLTVLNVDKLYLLPAGNTTKLSSKCELEFDKAVLDQVKSLISTGVNAGYRVSVAINGLVRSIKDTAINGNIISNKVELDIAELVPTVSIKYGDTIQVGIQTWVKDSSKNMKLNSEFPCYSKPIIIKYISPVVKNIYLMTMKKNK